MLVLGAQHGSSIIQWLVWLRVFEESVQLEQWVCRENIYILWTVHSFYILLVFF